MVDDPVAVGTYGSDTYDCLPSENLAAKVLRLEVELHNIKRQYELAIKEIVQLRALAGCVTEGKTFRDVKDTCRNG